MQQAVHLAPNCGAGKLAPANLEAYFLEKLFVICADICGGSLPLSHLVLAPATTRRCMTQNSAKFTHSTTWQPRG